MRDRLFALLGVESGEESAVSMLLAQSVFLGVFFGAFDISAHSLFLSIFDEKMMAKAYVVSGLAGIILTSLYTWLQTKLTFRNFATANLTVVTILTLLLWMGLLIFKAGWIVFLVFIMLGPLNILAALGFWGTAGRLFTLRQGKRLFGLVDSGLIAGIIISCYTIPVVLSLNFSSHNILLISASAAAVATFVQLVIGSRFNLATTVKKADDAAKKRPVISVLKKDRYISVMAVFVALSVMTAFFVQYSFMAVTRQQYPAEEDMARFLGIFTGSMMIFTLLIKLLAFSYLIRNYGLKISLTISPILISVLAVIGIIIGLTMGYTPAATSGFLIFFLILALSRLFSKSLKDSIESPSFKVIYQTLDERIRFEVQSAMDGTVNEIAALSSGLILAGLGMLSFIKLIHFSAVLFVIILFWIGVAFLLYSEYRKSIRRALETASPDSVRPVIAEGIRRRCPEETLSTAGQELHAPISQKAADARRILSGTRVPQAAEILRLLRDNSVDSKRFALHIIAKFRLTDMLTEVCSSLTNPSLETDAVSVLNSFGKDATGELQRYYMSLSGNSRVNAAILRILSRTPGPESSSFLFERLWAPSVRIRETAARGLLECTFTPAGEDLDRLHQLISDTAGIMAWNLAARVCLKKHGKRLLLGALDSEISRRKEFLFNLLSLAYDRSSIARIKENIEKDTVESCNFALEMIDIVIDESIKPKVIALLDMVPDEEKVRNLWHFFPGEFPVYNRLIEDIINRDYNLISIWTKTCTLRTMDNIDDTDLSESVSALLFSPETIIREEAARLISRTGSTIYRSVSPRIPEMVRRELDCVMQGGKAAEDFLFEKVCFLKKLFPGIPEDELLILSEKTVHAKDLSTGATCAPESIVWNLGQSSSKVLINDMVQKNIRLEGGSYYILPLSAVDEFNRHFPDTSGEILRYIDINESQN